MSSAESTKEVGLDPVAGLVSVVIPNYNHARYLPDAIDSVLRQTYPNREVIVVDDGSTDDSQHVADRYGDSIRYIYHDNQGLSAARNTGIRASRGEYIGVLDADDMYEPDFLATLVPILEAHPKTVAVTCGYQFVDEKNQPLHQIEARLVPPEDFFTALADGNFLVPESILVRSSCYREVGGFDTALRSCEDWDMWLRISRRFEVRGSDAVLVRHKVLPGSMSANPSRMYATRLAVLGKHFGPEKKGGATRREDGLKARAYGRAHLGSAVEFLQYGDRQQAGRCLLDMANACPALLTELPTFYELSFGRQPKGSRGDFASAPPDAEASLVGLLDDLFQSAEIKPAALTRRQTARALAYQALGMLAYGARRFPEARRLFGRGLAEAPGRVGPGILPYWLKSFLPPSWIDAIRRSRA
jgi:hypothetical protein